MNRKRFAAKTVAFAFAMALILKALPAPGATDIQSAFEQANKLYAQGKFPEAAAAYEELIQSGIAGPSLYFNLGNARYKAGKAGLALEAYRRAEQMAPRDPDLRANIAFLRDRLEGPSYRAGWIEKVLRQFTLNEWTGAASIAFWIWMLVLSARELWPKIKKPVQGVTWLAGIGTLILTGGLAAALIAASKPMAIVTAREVPVRNGPFEESPDAFVVRDGAELRILDSKDNWLQVTVGNRAGWISRDKVVLLSQSQTAADS